MPIQKSVQTLVAVRNISRGHHRKKNLRKLFFQNMELRKILQVCGDKALVQGQKKNRLFSWEENYASFLLCHLLERKPLNSTRTLVSHKLNHSLIEPSEKWDNVTISQKLSKQERINKSKYFSLILSNYSNDTLSVKVL